MSDIMGIVSCLRNIGIYMEDSMDKNDEALRALKLEDYIEDSITFMTFIIEIEQTFNINVTDEYLLPSRLETLDDVYRMISTAKAECL